MDDDLESIDHLLIDERTIDTRSKIFYNCQLIIDRSMLDETIIGYMEDEGHSDQDTCMIMIWWFRNYHNYLLGGVTFMFPSLLVYRSVSLSLSSPSLWLSPAVPFSLRPPSSPCPSSPPHISLFLSFYLSLFLSLSLSFSLSLFLSPTLSQHGKLGTRNMFFCSVPHITENLSITTYFHKISLNKCSTLIIFVIFLFLSSLLSWV